MEEVMNQGTLTTVGERGLKVSLTKTGHNGKNISAVSIGKKKVFDLANPIRLGLPIDKIKYLDNLDPRRTQKTIVASSCVIDIKQESNYCYTLITQHSIYNLEIQQETQ